MFRTSVTRFMLPVIFILIMPFSRLTGQVQEHEVPALRQQAVKHFEEGRYKDAEPEFEKLIRQFPRDAMYRYYAGICKVMLNEDLEEAVELLFYASTRGVPADVHFYLGEAYRKLYDFERAKQNYLTFDREAPRSMAREMDSKGLIRSATGGLQLTSMYNPYEILNVTFMNLHDLSQAEQIKMKGVQLTLKPDQFFSENEDRSDLNAYMFMPVNPERGRKVYFAGLERNGRDGFQIMESTRGNTGKWSDPKPLDLLNTEKDEILPYFDPVGNDIYFASNGREGLGGFDLFRSHYDKERDEWSEPVSLGFPVNSVYDDYLLLPGTDLGVVTFFSGRQTSDSSVAVYRVKLSEPKESLASRTPREIRRIANLGDAAEEMKQEIAQYGEPVAFRETNLFPAGNKGGIAAHPAKTTSGATEASNTKKEQSQNPSAASSDPTYQELVRKALRYQAETDSLTELATAARVKIRDSEDPNEKWLSQRQIMVWEKKADETQEQADQYFAMLADQKKKDIPATIEKDTVINEMTVYRFVDSGETTEKDEPETPDVNEKAKVAFGAAAGMTKPEKMEIAEEKSPAATGEKKGSAADIEKEKPAKAGNSFMGEQFSILPATPYSAENPIPVDEPLPAGTVYKIQMGVFSAPMEPSQFGGISPVTANHDPDRNLTWYYAGVFTHYEDAIDALPKVRSNGFPDAFIVSWYNGSKMSIEKARKLEK